MSDDEEPQVPGQRSPFRTRGKKDNKTYVEPDAKLIRTENVQERGGWIIPFDVGTITKDCSVCLVAGHYCC